MMSTKMKVLCVDDQADVAASTATILELAGFETRACLNGPEALIEAAAFCPDVCLIDLVMPGMAGDELLAKLRDASGGKPPRFIALTGSWDINSQHRTHNAGFEAHLVKPVEPDRLVAAVRGEEALAAAPTA